jgi:peptide/nickel transport system permease protein
MFLSAFIGPIIYKAITGWEYSGQDFTAFLSPPSASHWFGTTQIGGDVFAQTMRGLQKSLLIGLLVAVISTGLAAIVGSVAGYFGGWVDRALMWIVDLLLVVPSFILIAIVTPRLGQSARVIWLIVLFSVFSWMISSRMVRGLTMSLRMREFVAAARYMGVSNWRIIVRHILPNVASILIIDTALNVAVAILGETGLSFLGFGIQPPDVSLGTLIADGTKSATTFPWLFLIPAGVLVLIALCANLTGDGLRDALDPGSRALRRRRRK